MMDLASIKSAIATPSFGNTDLPAHVGAFCTFISPWQKQRATDVSANDGVLYQNTASLGFKLAFSSDDPGLRDAFEEGATQLSGRTYFAPGRAPRFEIDGVAMLGIALGYRAVAAPAESYKWLSDCLAQSSKALEQDPWQRSFVSLARCTLQDFVGITDIDPILNVSFKAAMSIPIERDEFTAAWELLVGSIGEQDHARVAALQGVYEACAAAMARLPVHGAGVPELIEILVGVSESMSHWTYEETRRVTNIEPQKWEIDHEYHVQNLLWTVLRPIFPDLIDEETLKKLGHKSARYDLGIPSLQTIIEVKFMRKRGQRELANITEQVAADHSLYLREGTSFTKMIVFIWDEVRQTEEYKTLSNGLESLAGIEKVVILPRPARMERLSETS